MSVDLGIGTGTWEHLSNQAIAAAGVVYFLALVAHLVEWSALRTVPVRRPRASPYPLRPPLVRRRSRRSRQGPRPGRTSRPGSGSRCSATSR